MNMTTNELLPLINTADVMVTVGGRLGYITHAVRDMTGLTFFVADDETRAKLAPITVAEGGSIEIVSMIR